MKAEDTVMNDKQIIKASGKLGAIFPLMHIGELEEQLKAQAAISFRAGEDQGYKNGHTSGYNLATSEDAHSLIEQARVGRMAGIKEAVEWVRANASVINIFTTGGKSNDLAFPIHFWQAKLKEWGIEK